MDALFEGPGRGCGLLGRHSRIMDFGRFNARVLNLRGLQRFSAEHYQVRVARSGDGVSRDVLIEGD